MLKAKQFDQIFKSGIRVSGPLLRFIALPTNELGDWGVAISSKLPALPSRSTGKPNNPSARASHARRNRIKRRIREAIRLAQINPEGMHCVVMAGVRAESATLQELIIEVQALSRQTQQRLMAHEFQESEIST